MRFLVITKSAGPVPPEAAIDLFDALSGWAKDLLAKGKLEQTWAFAGLQAGGGIFNVESLEELDSVMGSFPLAAFSSIEILGLVDLEASLETSKTAVRAMMPH